MKTFFGGNFIKEEMLSEAGIYHPIKLEYYKRINEDEILKENKAKFENELKSGQIPTILFLYLLKIKHVKILPIKTEIKLLNQVNTPGASPSKGARTS